MREALARGATIEAIKLLRTATGLGLKEAKDVIDAHAASRPAPSFGLPIPNRDLPADAIDALTRGSKIEAIRLVREQRGLGLKEAKDAVDAYERTHTATAGLSPGEVRGGGAIWWVVATVALCVAGYYLLRRWG